MENSSVSAEYPYCFASLIYDDDYNYDKCIIKVEEIKEVKE